MDDHVSKYTEGHFVAMGTAWGIPVGVVLAIAVGNFGLVGIGIPIGFAIGLGLEEKYRRQGRLRPLSDVEKRRRKRFFIIGALVLIIGIAAFFMTWL